MNQTLTRSRSRLALGVAAPVVLVLSLAACGGGSSGGATTATPNASATGAPGAGGGFGGNFEEIRSCLSAAGITLPTQSGMPSFSGGTRPSGMPSFSPGGTPPSGAPNGGGGRGNSEFQKILQSDEAQAALKACGITMPTGRPSGAPSAS